MPLLVGSTQNEADVNLVVQEILTIGTTIEPLTSVIADLETVVSLLGLALREARSNSRVSHA